MVLARESLVKRNKVQLNHFERNSIDKDEILICSTLLEDKINSMPSSHVFQILINFRVLSNKIQPG
jgi:hypothetical protein